MSLSKKTSCMAVGGALLVTSGVLAIKRYKDYKNWRAEIEGIPWDVPKEYTSWKTLFRGPRYSRSGIVT